MLGEREGKYGVDCSFRSNKYVLSIVKRKKIALKTLDDGRYYTDRYYRVPWGYIPSSFMTQETISFIIDETLSKAPRKNYIANKTKI